MTPRSGSGKERAGYIQMSKEPQKLSDPSDLSRPQVSDVHPIPSLRGLPPEKAVRVIEWMFQAREGDDTEQGLLAMVLSGDMLVVVADDGAVSFALTEQGRAMAERAILESPHAAEIWERLNGPSPKGTQ